MATKKPHIIIFNPDEMRADSLHHLGNPAAVTPNLDAFAREDAVSFSHAFCQNPVCVPSRCSFFTGLYPHVHGHRTMRYLLHPGEKTLFSELRDHGYYVWMNDRNDLFAGQIEGWAESNADEIFYNGTRAQIPQKVNAEIRGEPGNKYYYSHFGGELRTDAQGEFYSADDAAVDAAIERLTHPADDRPICAFMGLLYPHPAYQVEEPYYSSIDKNKIPPRIREDCCSGKAKLMTEIRKNSSMEDFTETDWETLRATYLAMCMKVDAQFGRLVNALKKAGIYDDCAIFVLSDHGDFTGDYGLPEKAQNCFEDCLTRVPLLVKPPKDTEFVPGISDSLVELVDFFATAMDFAGVVPSYTQFGRSVRPLLADHCAELRPFVCCEGGRTETELHCDEYHSYQGGAPTAAGVWPRLVAQADSEAHAKGIMLRTNDYKYVSRILGTDELYDLKQDPGETWNRIDAPEYASVIAQMRYQMLKWLEQTDDVVPYSYDDRFMAETYYAQIRRQLPPQFHEQAFRMLHEGMTLDQIVRQLQP